MLRKLLDEGIEPIVLFANTGKERDETLTFVHEVEVRWSVPVIWLEYCRVPTCEDNVRHLKTERMRNYAAARPEMHWFRVVNYETAARHTHERGPFDELLEWMNVLPNVRSRACSSELKVRTMRRYLWSMGIYSLVSHIGIRFDEWDRAADLIHAKDRDMQVGYRFILAEHGITVSDVDEFWRQQEFDLRLQHYEGNCHLCFLKRKAVKQRLIREQPELTRWWKEWEKRKAESIGIVGNGCRWRAEKGHAIADLERNAIAPTLFDDGLPAMECACTAGTGLGDYDDHC